MVLPAVEELQRGQDTRWRWVNYSAFDATSTYDLYTRLRQELAVMEVELDPAVRADYEKVRVQGVGCVWWCVGGGGGRGGCCRLGPCSMPALRGGGDVAGVVLPLGIVLHASC